VSKLVKPTPAELMEDTGTGLDYGTRPDRMPGYLVPNDRFYVRSHAPTPAVDVADWTLRLEGDGVRQPVAYRYDELWNRFPLVSVIRTIECAGNRRVLLGEEFGSAFKGTQWGRGAIGTAEWTGVRLRDLLEPADLAPGAREVMPESLDAIRARRPMPLAKAKADDSALKAKATSIQLIVAKYQSTAHELDQKGIQQQDLLRKVKTEEDNFLLYEHKREEARMTDALDQTRILNVAIAEQPGTPALPSNSRWLVFGLGAVLALAISAGAAFTLEYTNPSFRTPSEVLSELNIPVLAAVPHYTHAFAGNGNGNGYSNGNGNGNGHSVFVNHDATVEN